MPHFNILEQAGIPQRKKRERGIGITEDMKKSAEELGFDFYDGSREKGYGGYYYDGRWKKVAEVIKERYKLNADSKVLIDRCHKGFLVFDLMKLIPGIAVYGIHPKEYCLNHAMEGYGRWALMNKDVVNVGNDNIMNVIRNVSSGESDSCEGDESRSTNNINEDPKIIEEKARQEIIPFLIKADSLNLPFKDNYFDCVISIENACSFVLEDCKKVIKEIIRVSKENGKRCYIQGDSWTNENEEKKLRSWSFLNKTFLDVEGWEKLFEELGYEGDYGFTIIE